MSVTRIVMGKIRRTMGKENWQQNVYGAKDYTSKSTKLDDWLADYKVSNGNTRHFRKCQHDMDRFDLEDGLRIYLSAYSAVPNMDDTSVRKSAGCYMYSGWIQDGEVSELWLSTDAMYSVVKLAHYPSGTYRFPALYISWADGMDISLEAYDSAVHWCIDIIENGHILDIGCYGAHGRTGTLLAGILVNQGIDPESAINRVREDYCDQAIETKIQEKLIHTYGMKCLSKNGGIKNV